MAAYFWFVRGSTHAAMCATSIESVRRVDPQARCFVITDEQTPEWSVPAGIVFIDPGMPIMQANLEAQITAMFMAQMWDEPVIFLDTDIILLQKLPCLGDLTITWRDHVGMKDDEKVEGVAAQMPYNYGVMIARPGRRATEALIFMRERIRKMHSRFQDWYGNQLALAELAGAKPATEQEIVTRRIPWSLVSQGSELTVAKIPCETFNFTPQQAGEDVSGKAVLHFKGKSRALMEGYAKELGLGWAA